MLSREALEAYRRMTFSERLILTIQATREAQPYLSMGPPEVVRRRFEAINRENAARNAAIIAGLAKAYPPELRKLLIDDQH
ncbi:hypothetical protein [Planctomicrobium piriforme]|uniref:Uncharacterized protein n=1 Tax=Planctomicrobium piriforme TaxID=1576369 RepID=A0A1I3BIT0_9PLAN|nr:hypothetical protein [Planctomicrobium piriforme]SFH62215.1 hypothetical protein SAMN05421753_101480 [Planctomicrobium piriforme]